MRPLLIFLLKRWSYIKFSFDYVLFITLLLFFSNKPIFEKNLDNITIILILYIPLFIFNYFLDKYKSIYKQKEFLKHLFIKSLVGILSSFFVISFFLNLNSAELIKSTVSNFNFRLFDFYFFLISFLIQVFIEFLRKKLPNFEEKWLVIGATDINNYFNSNIPNYFKFEYIEKIDKNYINNKKLGKYKGIIFQKINEENDELINSFFTFTKLEILSFSRWCEKYLGAIPSEFNPKEKIFSKSLNYKNKAIELKIKRLGDIFLSLFLIFVTFPLILIIAILIKLEDGGPVFYCQKRIGLNFLKFTIIKFRSMRIDAEKDKAQWSYKDDPRITKIGKIIRKTRIDEIPQLWSVLKGEMSLIGPRPERPEFYEILEKKINNYALRCQIRPGLSGWAQVNYPYGSTIKDANIKLSYDTFYINNFSFYLDFLIMIKTIKIVLLHKGT